MKDQLDLSKERVLFGKVSFFFSSGFYFSLLPFKLVSLLKSKYWGKSIPAQWSGSGLIGSLWGVVTYLYVPEKVAMSPVSLALALALSIFVSQQAEKYTQIKDDSRIVIDEWIGMWIALLGFPQEIGLTLVVSFCFFRVYDVFKGPWGRWLQTLPGGFGVTLDDVAAGLLANASVRLLSLFLTK